MSVFGWAFTAPMLLWGLLALPILWLILRAIPPAPLRRRFPAVILLLGLKDDAKTADRTPWWLLLLRALAIAAAIIGFAGPTRAPVGAAQSDLPLLIVMDGGWAEAHDWQALRSAALDAAAGAGRAGRKVAAVQITAPPAAPQWQSADSLTASLAATVPAPFAPTEFTAWAEVLGAEALDDAAFDTLWLSDGIDHAGRGALVSALQAKGAVEVVLPTRTVFGLAPATFKDGEIEIPALRLPALTQAEVTVLAIGTAPNAAESELGRATASFARAAGEAVARLTLPPELRNRITRFEIEGQRSAGAVSLTDDALKRRKVAIIGAAPDAEGLRLLSPTHYLTTALSPSSDLLLGGIAEVLPSGPDTIILADVGKVSAAETESLLQWIEGGGTLLRFAGPRLAAAEFADGVDALLPVRLRAGGRQSGGAMTWGSAMQLAPFDAASPFAGLTIDDDVTVSAQVLAQPDPDLTAATLAALSDGTPLVTRRKLGAGQIVLFHTTANAEWTNLPLSGLFLQMLERLAVASRSEAATMAEVTAGFWQPQRLTGPFGGGQDGTQLAGVAGAALWGALEDGPSRAEPAGLYVSDTRKIALNVLGAGASLAAFDWPNAVTLRATDAAPPKEAKGPLLAVAAMLLALDVIGSLFVGGKLGAGARTLAALLLAPLFLSSLAVALAPPAHAQVEQAQSELAETAGAASDFAALRATRGVVLAHVITGDRGVDEITKAGLQGLSDVLTYRTSIEPEPPISVNIETDTLDFFPFLYWPISPSQDLPSPTAIAKLNRFMRTGGMIMFDTRAGDLGDATAQNMLQLLTTGLDIPPLDIVPQDHVLTRSFYLIGGFPGRYDGPPVWVEAAIEDTETAPEGMPFRNLNDGVSPVIIGSNDWAGAWAADEWGNALLPVGRGFAGEEQREYAYRFGVNVIMHVLTGNYKSDQVHVPALLDRLGQ